MCDEEYLHLTAVVDIYNGWIMKQHEYINALKQEYREMSKDELNWIYLDSINDDIVEGEFNLQSLMTFKNYYGEKLIQRYNHRKAVKYSKINPNEIQNLIDF
jgi:hypothetical protein